VETFSFSYFTRYFSRDLTKSSLQLALFRNKCSVKLKKLLDTYLTTDKSLYIVILLSIVCIQEKISIASVPPYSETDLLTVESLYDLITKSHCLANIQKVWPYITRFEYPEIKISELQKLL
jgi:hypothetical protein